MAYAMSESRDSLPALLERAAQTHRSLKAFGACAWQPTYEELNAKANALARLVVHETGRKGDRVAILMDHDSPEIAAILSVLKAGRIVVVLNPNDPPSRLSYIVKNAEAKLILTQEAHRKLANEVAGPGGKVLAFDPDRSEGAAHGPDVVIFPDDVATLTYTSGSTGAPKAVMQTHRQIVPNVIRQSRSLELVPEDRVALIPLLSGSHGLIILWCALANGCSLWPFSVGERSIDGLAGWMNDNKITVFILGPSLFRHFTKTLRIGDRIPSVHVVKLTTEAATSEDFAAFQRHFSDRCNFLNILSASEAGSIATLRLSHGDRVAEGMLPAGRIDEGVEVLLLDADGKEVRQGEIGEIVIRGHGLAAGYWRNEALTAERFLDDPRGNGLRIFRSGDLGRFDAHGLLEVCGRKDTRIKIRGYQVEPAEVERALLDMSGIAGAAVYGIDGGPTLGTLLAASIALAPAGGPSVAAVRQALRDQLPGYMVPSSIMTLASLPVTPNGKINREALRQDHRRMREKALSEAPETPTEELLAEIWADAFGLEAIGRKEDFFDLGGDSLIAAVIAAKVSDTLKVDIGLGMFTECPILANQAAAIDERVRSGAERSMPPLLRVRRNGPLPLSFSQERIWQSAHVLPAGNHMSAAYRILGPLDAEILRDCIGAMARRHEILRTNYIPMNGRPAAVVRPPEPVALPFLDLSGEIDAEERARKIFAQERARRFDLGSGPLLRFFLIKMGDNEHRLLRLNQHMISDADTWPIYLRELERLYDAKLHGRPSSLPESEPLQYADYAAWQRHVFRPGMPAYDGAIEWWSQQLRGARGLDFPYRRPRPLPGIDPAQGAIGFEVDAGGARTLDELRRQTGATFYMSRLAVLALVIAAETNNPDVVLGTYATNRRRMATRSMLGFFSNPVTLRLRCDPAVTFRNWLVTVRDIVVEAAAHSELPYDELFRHFTQSRIPVPYLTAFCSASQERNSWRFADLEMELLREQHLAHMPSGFDFRCTQGNGKERFEVLFDAGIYDPAAVREFADRFLVLLASVSRQPDFPLRQIVSESFAGRGRQMTSAAGARG